MIVLLIMQIGRSFIDFLFYSQNKAVDLGYVKQKSAFRHVHYAQIQIILPVSIESSWAQLFKTM